jgi:hypothetical protein
LLLLNYSIKTVKKFRDYQWNFPLPRWWFHSLWWNQNNELYHSIWWVPFYISTLNMKSLDAFPTVYHLCCRHAGSGEPATAASTIPEKNSLNRVKLFSCHQHEICNKKIVYFLLFFCKSIPNVLASCQQNEKPPQTWLKPV